MSKSRKFSKSQNSTKNIFSDRKSEPKMLENHKIGSKKPNSEKKPRQKCFFSRKNSLTKRGPLYWVVQKVRFTKVKVFIFSFSFFIF